MTTKQHFRPMFVFDRWAMGAADTQMSGYPTEDFEEYYPKWFIYYLQRFWFVRGSITKFIWGWWWVVYSDEYKKLIKKMELENVQNK